MRVLIATWLLLTGATCSSSESTTTTQPAADGDTPAPPAAASSPSGQTVAANVQGVSVSGEPGAYTFAVTLLSPDAGCEQYANWWEVLDSEGQLLYRRILAHSHAGEQPFTRSGGPVPVQADDTVFVRAHMNQTGYGGIVFRGTPGGSFSAATDLPTSFATDVEDADPQPDGCAF